MELVDFFEKPQNRSDTRRLSEPADGPTAETLIELLPVGAAFGCDGGAICGAWGGLAADNCIDGDITGNMCHMYCGKTNPFLQIDLGASMSIDYVEVFNRNTGNSNSIERLGSYELYVGSTASTASTGRLVPR